MPPKTLYVKDEQLWEKAKSLAGSQGFSRVIMKLLAQWVEAEEKRQRSLNSSELTEIELWIGGDEHRQWYPKDALGGNYKIAFTGRLLESTEPWHFATGGRTIRPASNSPLVKVYEMSDRRLVIYRDFRELLSTLGATCVIYSSYEDLCRRPGSLDTDWDLTGLEDELHQMSEVDTFATRTQKQESLVNVAQGISNLREVDDVWEKGGTEREVVKELLLNSSPEMTAKAKVTAADIDSCYETVKREAFDAHFQESIANALGVERIVRLDHRLF